MLFNEVDFYRSNDKMRLAISDAKELFGESLPYVVERRLEGNVVVFSDRFIRCVREALSNGCLAKMSSDEEELFLAYVAFRNGTGYRDITKDNNEITQALDDWLVRILNCETQPKINECFDADLHKWSTCG